MNCARASAIKPSAVGNETKLKLNHDQAYKLSINSVLDRLDRESGRD